jgi:hypothetical protein
LSLLAVAEVAEVDQRLALMEVLAVEELLETMTQETVDSA